MVVLLLLLFVPSTVDATQLDQQRQQFKQAYELIQSGKDYNLAAVSKGLEDYLLYPYLQFEDLYSNIAVKPEAQIKLFLNKNAATPLAKRLRLRWLYSLARHSKWQLFLRQYKADEANNRLRCYRLQARIKTTPVDKALLNDIKTMWLVGKSQVDECDPAFKVLYKSKAMTGTLIKQRIRLAVDAKNIRLAKALTRRLNASDQKKMQLLFNVYSNPKNYLDDNALKKDSPLSREIIATGLKRLANQDAIEAYNHWHEIVGKYTFSLTEKQAIDREIAFKAVQQKEPLAGKWLDRLQKQQSSQYIQRYLIRYATQNQDWHSLEKWTRKKVATGFNKIRWQYWRARSLEETKQQKAANVIFKDLANKRDYYGFLSAEKLGQNYQFHDRRLLLSDQQRKKLFEMPGIARTSELYKLEFYEDARREWSYITARMSRDQLLQASVLAYEWRWYDRTILTLGKAKAYDDLTRRFPLPFNKTILKYAEKRLLPASKVYTLMRSESAFIHDVRSSAGAMGLMQLMPATAKQTAKKIGYKYKNSRQLYDPVTNIALGTAYLKEMLERFDGSFIMAAAAYNAGPHRVKRWRPQQGCMDGEFWVETIPFNETRRYVRRALFYSVLYQWRMKEKISGVQAQLKPVPALEATCH